MKRQSQHGQDIYFNDNIFRGKRGGIFLDIGAHDGIAFSNTYSYEKEMGWDGICVEPNPGVYSRLIKNRGCKCYNNCISDVRMELDFMVIKGYSEMLSGIVSNYDDRHIKRIRDEVRERGGELEIIKVMSETVTGLSERSGIYRFDLCSIDVEGSEIKILRSIDFGKVDIDYFVIENNYGSDEIKSYMESKGYEKFHKIETDECYRRRDG